MEKQRLYKIEINAFSEKDGYFYVYFIYESFNHNSALLDSKYEQDEVTKKTELILEKQFPNYNKYNTKITEIYQTIRS